MRAQQSEINWAQVAADLGYTDQAHLTRDFTAAVGVSPTGVLREAKLRSIYRD